MKKNQETHKSLDIGEISLQLIGKKCEIIYHNASFNGVIINETKNTIDLQTENETKKLQKSLCQVKITNNNKIYEYDGKSKEIPGGHIILITGWLDDTDVVNGGYWIIKNSAGQQWGENGFGKAAYGQAGIDDFYIIYAKYL